MIENPHNLFKNRGDAVTISRHDKIRWKKTKAEWQSSGSPLSSSSSSSLFLSCFTHFHFSLSIPIPRFSTVRASMAERVHPTDDSLHPYSASNNNSVNSGNSLPPPPKNPPPGTYVIQIPKDQVYRVPPPENAVRFNLYTRHNHRPCPCRRFLSFILLLLILFLVLTGIASALFFLILQPVFPRYSILAVSINGFKQNTTSISPQFNVALRAENQNKKIGIYYEKNSSVMVYFSDVMLCKGALPLLYQPSSNVTVMAVELKGSGIRLSSSGGKALQDWEKQGKMRLRVDLKAPLKLKVYWVKTWTIKAKVLCKILVKKVTGKTKVMEERCDHSMKLW
ncbi:NDR1/HIN1-like protein 13 [Benincasa hispida]|uniref:NDR1/HIN1-like protein 13 n=1 Tax=Benincasa hispida TaxID=102211 RepID=UPI0018FF7333|nr:NDR1/HIN1-like protein 13 [Benincasa hispida]